jgi:multidrug resistance efflux pump
MQQRIDLRDIRHSGCSARHAVSQSRRAQLRANALITAQIPRAERQQAEADVKVAVRNLQRSNARAPRDGQVTNVHLAQGNYL